MKLTPREIHKLSLSGFSTHDVAKRARISPHEVVRICRRVRLKSGHGYQGKPAA